MPRSRGVPDFSRQQEKGTTAVNDFRPLQGPGRGKHAAARESTLWEVSLTGPGRNYSPRREAVPDEAACTQRPAFAPKVLTAKTVPQDNSPAGRFLLEQAGAFSVRRSERKICGSYTYGATAATVQLPLLSVAS